MESKEKTKMLAMLAAITAQVLNSMGNEISTEQYNTLEKCNSLAWDLRGEGILPETFYFMAKDAERATGFG